MLSIKITANWAILDYWKDLPEEFRAALARKMEYVADLLEEKVLQNVGGEILQVKSGALRRKIRKEVNISDDKLEARVGPRPAGPKEWALEYGGAQGWYPIEAPRGYLANKAENFFVKGWGVFHPPAKEYAYLRKALDEIAPIAKEMLLSAFLESRRRM